jgi:general secretion pathway protein A
MFLDYYNLQEQPFGVTPDPRFLFSSGTHREALAALLYGVEAGCGFVALIAKPGLGKTTLLFHALNQLRDRVTTVFLFQTVCTPLDLMRVVLNGLGVQEPKGSLIEMQLRLKQLLAEHSSSGKRVVVVIDEAQNLDDSVLELVRMLSNFETSSEKLIQILLSGQPQLAEKIGSPDLVQLRQRISIVACLTPFSLEETTLYIEHRLRVAGYSFAAPLFTREAVALIAECSDGIARNINNLCFNSISLGCALQRKPIDAGIVREVIADLDLEKWRRKRAAAVPEENKSAPPVPAFLSSASAPPRMAGWLQKAAIATALLLAIGGSLFEIHRWPVPKISAQTNTAAGAAAAGASTASPAIQKPRPETSSATGAEANSAQSAGMSAAPLVTNPAPSTGNQGLPTEVAAKGLDAHTTPPVPTAGLPANIDEGVQSVDSVSEIRVMPGGTLLGICVENFGSCNSEILQEIHRLNPRLSNLDHIEPGQSIRIPAAAKFSRTSVVDQTRKASLTEKGMQ